MDNRKIPGLSSQISQKSNGTPPCKRPKLSIDKFTNNSSIVASQNNPITKPKDDFDDIWGEDLDVIELGQVDETLALSQMPQASNIETAQKNISCRPSTNVGVSGPSGFNDFNRNIKQPFVNSRIEKPSGLQPNRTITNTTKNNQRGTPLRRTASSGWPTANTFSHPTSNQSRIIEPKQPLNNYNHLHRQFEEQLKIEVDNLKGKLDSKSGEVSLLRHKLQEKSKEINKLQIDYTEKINLIKKEAKSAIDQLSKENQSLKSKFEVEVMEKEMRGNRINQGSPFRIKNARQNFSPSRSRQTYKECSFLIGHSLVRADTQSLPYDLFQEVIKPGHQPSQPEAFINETIRTITSQRLFSDDVERRPSDNAAVLNPSIAGTSKSSYITARTHPTCTSRKDQSLVVANHLNDPGPSLEPCKIMSAANRLLNLSSENEHQIIPEVIERCHHVIKNQLDQLESSVCPQNKCLEREQEVTLCGYKNLILSDEYNLLYAKELYNNERGISARRALKLISILVEFFQTAALHIVPSTTTNNKESSSNKNNLNCSTVTLDSNKLLQTVKELVTHVENQRRTLMFEGVLAGVADLVKTLIQTNLELTTESQNLLVEILKSIVFARPGSLVLHIVLQALLAATKYPILTDKLCQNSAKKTFYENELKYFTFTPDSCVLQVLCVALQVAESPRKILLADVYASWILSLFDSITRSPHWLFANPANTSCQCRPQVSRLAFTLVGEACLLYSTVPDNGDDKKLLEAVLRRGVLVVYTLLYHDEFFGYNVDAASNGYYELFISCMSQLDIELPTPMSKIQLDLAREEESRIVFATEGEHNKHKTLLLPAYASQNPNRPGNVLEYLDSL